MICMFYGGVNSNCMTSEFITEYLVTIYAIKQLNIGYTLGILIKKSILRRYILFHSQHDTDVMALYSNILLIKIFTNYLTPT